MSDEQLPTPEPDPEPENEVKFKFKKIKEKPKRAYRKGSKYDPIIDGFLEMEEKLAEISIEKKDANYIRTQLSKRVEARKLDNLVKVSVVNNKCYLERA